MLKKEYMDANKDQAPHSGCSDMDFLVGSCPEWFHPVRSQQDRR
jgi:hypothetical protein